MVASAASAGGAVLFVLGLGLYMLPTIIGDIRKVVSIGPVFAINLLLGWSLIGWLAALAMALQLDQPCPYPQMWQPLALTPESESPCVSLPSQRPPRLPTIPASSKCLRAADRTRPKRSERGIARDGRSRHRSFHGFHRPSNDARPTPAHSRRLEPRVPSSGVRHRHARRF